MSREAGSTISNMTEGGIWKASFLSGFLKVAMRIGADYPSGGRAYAVSPLQRCLPGSQRHTTG
ncbi:MAG: hypothetical protein SPL56_11280 [Lachnospiraceae bacterium]|nr:hypothetical protein [Lachnospiraceae bacterium]